MLLELEEIQKRLDEQFLPMEPMLTGFRLVPSVTRQEEIDALARQLNVAFAGHFQVMLGRFDFGHFTLGPIAFCNTGDYRAWLLQINDDETPYPWWGQGLRPGELLLIANSDPYAVLLNNATEEVLAFEHGQPWRDHAITVAVDFVQFLQGLGTTMLLRNKQGSNATLAEEVSTDVGGGPGNTFWHWLAR